MNDDDYDHDLQQHGLLSSYENTTICYSCFGLFASSSCNGNSSNSSKSTIQEMQLIDKYIIFINVNNSVCEFESAQR